MSHHPTTTPISLESPHRGLSQSTGLTDEQLAALSRFVEQVGGIDNAQLALESLEKLKPAA